MSWRKITIKFTGKCIICNKPVSRGETGLWAKNIGIKHTKCVNNNNDDVTCIICKDKIACSRCEFHNYCNTQLVSYCMCQNCMTNDKLMDAYKKSLHNIKI